MILFLVCFRKNGKMQRSRNLKYKIEEKLTKVGIIGLGYVGLPLSAAIAEAGFQVTGIDIDKDKLAQLNLGHSHIKDLPSSRLSKLTHSRKLTYTSDLSVLPELDVICICVPTPLSKTKTPDISNIVSVAESVAKYLRSEQLIILESTTYPGTTDEVVRPILEQSKLIVGVDVYLAFSPERIDPGNKSYGLKNTPKVVGGITPKCTKLATLFYQQFINSIYQVSSSQSAETVKLLENTFRAVNIALANEFAQICDKMNLDVWEIINAAASKPFGFMPFYPGPGLGGHCIPVDPHYLAWKSRIHGYSPQLIDLASDINVGMRKFVVSKVAEKLSQTNGKIEGSKILIIGVTYKRDVADLRESPALKIIELLNDRGAQITYHDPLIAEMVIDGITYQSNSLTDSILTESDLILILADHSTIDYERLLSYKTRILDTRNCLNN